MKILFGILIMFCLVSPVLANIDTNDAYRMDNFMGGVASEVQLGTLVNRTKNLQTAEFDATGGKNIGSYTLDIKLPDNAVVTNSWYDVITTFTSSSSDAIMSIKSASANDIVAAKAISHEDAVWAAGIHSGIQTGSTSTFIKMASVTDVVLMVATQSLTAGKLVLFTEYVISK